MSDSEAHLFQAGHNESLANDLLSLLNYKDWLITISFYSAIHYVEAKLCKMSPSIHSDINIPIDRITRKPMYSPHSWREKLIGQYFRPIYKDYRNLRVNSQIARYLCTMPGRYLEKDVIDYFADSFAINCYQKNLQNIKKHLSPI